MGRTLNKCDMKTKVGLDMAYRLSQLQQSLTGRGYKIFVTLRDIDRCLRHGDIVVRPFLHQG